MNSRRRVWLLLAVGGSVVLARPCASAEDIVAQKLALELTAEGNHAAAALEFRRAATATGDAVEQGALYWLAAFEYWRAGQGGVAEKLLDRAEDVLPEPHRPALRLLQAEVAAKVSSSVAAFYYKGLTDSGAAPELRRYASRQLAVQRLRSREMAAARKALETSSGDETAGLEALSNYAKGKDKRPMLGGVLGIIPGFGYFYSGEYANGFRSLLLNSLFIFGMVHTASEDQWGAFAAITFFEFTWYSGSIYGGLDAAHRFNRRRLERAERGILGAARFEPDWKQIPVLSLRFIF